MKKKIKNGLREIFNKHDPIGIYFGKETNFDEYDPEISGVIIRFNRSKNVSEFTSEIHNLVTKMFSKEIAGEKSKYKKLAKEVYEFLNKKLNK